MASFTIAEADALVPEVAARMAELAVRGREAAEAADRARRRARRNGQAGGADAGAVERLREGLAWFEERGIQIKSVAPPLVDFPACYGNREVLLCWTEGEERIAWYHLPEAGFAGRRPISELEA